MRKTGWRAWVLLLLAFLVTLVVMAPATLLAKIVEEGSEGKFVLANATGTMWRGSAIPAIRQLTGGLFVLEKLHWDMSMLPLLRGKASIEFRWDNIEQIQPVLATVSYGRIELRNVIVPLHAGILGELSPLLRPVQLSGKMQISSESFTISKQGMSGTVVADWMNAGSVLSSVNPLGSYRINVVAAGERLDATLATTAGVLMLEGRGNFTLGRGLNFKGTARASEDSRGSLNELLGNLGPESSPGVHTFNLMQ
ncbi:MAG TPA: type II secretion system protein N, partial [Gallionellaceae bacterium]|jgi:general secretion pathway protein N|nr:type II secretion system protein N [Gallionellaceae bacterium]